MLARDETTTTVVVGYTAGRLDARVVAPIAGLVVLAAMLTLAAVV